jgi:hypothetical protein
LEEHHNSNSLWFKLKAGFREGLQHHFKDKELQMTCGRIYDRLPTHHGNTRSATVSPAE